MPAKKRNPTPKPPSHDLDKTTIPAENYLGKSQASYIKSAEEGNFDGFSVESAKPSGAAAAGKSEDLSLESHLKVGGVAGEPADKQVLIRVTESCRLRWQEAARLEGLSVSEFVRGLVDVRVRGLLECGHVRRKFYKWPGRRGYSFCLDCGVRIVDGE